MQNDIERVLIDRATIARRVEEVAGQITRDHCSNAFSTSQPGEITLVPILTGSLMFVADLIRHMPVYMQIRMLSITSYPGTATATQGAKVRGGLSSLPDSLEDSHVLLIDDILDSGNTLRLCTELLAERRPASLRTCVLLRKDRPEARAFHVDYVCFDIPDEFIVGYGLDFNDYYRNLPEIVSLKPEVIAGAASED